MKRQKRVVQRRGRSPQPSRQSSDLRNAEFDQARLATQTYLTVRQLVAYWPHFETEKAAYKFLERHRVPKCRDGRAFCILRRDFDAVVQASRAVNR